MSAPRPWQAREPDCVHTLPGSPHQPASACRVCKDGEPLRRWADGWAAWLAENPDSPEARYLRRTAKEA